jgi:hypothetical protein
MKNKPKRKSLSKKLRFEVFKRDSFTCQYCGQMPPTVVLEIDHIVPVVSGGENEIENLITSCFDCNRGKGPRLLSSVPKSISDNLQSIKEKEDQIGEYRKFVKKIKRREKKDIGLIVSIFEESFPGYVPTEKFKNVSIGRFLNKLPLHEVENAMFSAVSRMTNRDRCLKYFCGICWAKIREVDGARK